MSLGRNRIEISSKAVEVTVNNKEENSEDFCLDFVQECSLCTLQIIQILYSRKYFFGFFTIYVNILVFLQNKMPHVLLLHKTRVRKGLL